jgi:hypothetical protein
MQLQPDLWIEGKYHVDFSPRGELRIVGRDNHLYLGLAGFAREEIEISSVERRGQKLYIKGGFTASRVHLLDPVVRSVRQVRSLVERHGRDRTFAEVLRESYDRVAPNEIQFELYRGRPSIRYRRNFSGDWYGVRFLFPKAVAVARRGEARAFELEASSPISFEIIVEDSFRATGSRKKVLKSEMIDLGRFRDRADFIKHLYERTAIEISHLVAHDKTSGFEYGTIFPRDWMESADLGEGDLAPRAVDYMYQKALQFVSPEGVGWHENLTGEAAYEAEQARQNLLTDIRQTPLSGLERSLDLVTREKAEVINRQMIDIEPRYLMGLERVSPAFWRDKESVEKIRRVAQFVLSQAREKSVITFREKPAEIRRHRDDRYFDVGNWRDGVGAFARAKDPIAPFDVNVVFYPAALRSLRRFEKRLGLEIPDLEELIEKWEGVESLFRFKAGSYPAYALALSEAETREGKDLSRRLEVTHADEAYLLAYGEPDRPVVRSFAERLLDPRYFYTPSGPVITGLSEGDYSSLVYHGHVIWTKQTAFCSYGISRQIRRAKRERWSKPDQALLAEALNSIFATSLRAFAELGGIPELYYDHEGQARFYDSQPEAQGQMSKVQLWSAVGARRILRDYYEFSGQL